MEHQNTTTTTTTTVETNNNNNGGGDFLTVDYFNKKRSESREDLLSETGTYTIENDNLLNAGELADSLDVNNNAELRELTIDETFGINNNSSNKKLVDSISAYLPTKVITTTKMVDETYSSTMSTSESMNSSMTSSGSSTNEVTINGEESNDKQARRSAKKYSSRIKKTLTYDVIKDNCDDNNPVREVDDNNSDDDDNSEVAGAAKSTTTTTRLSINTNLLLGDTDDLINKINEKKKLKSATLTTQEFDALSTRVVVNGSQTFSSLNLDEQQEVIDFNRQKNGGLSFNVELDQQKVGGKPPIFDFRRTRSKTETTTTTTADSISTETEPYTKSVLTEPSLGAKIQQKAIHNSSTLVEQRRPSLTSSEKDAKVSTLNNSVNSKTSSLSSNRTLYLRQQSAKAKRDSLNNSITTTSTNNPQQIPSSTKTNRRTLNDPTKASILKASTNSKTPQSPQKSHVIRASTKHVSTSRSSSPATSATVSHSLALSSSNLHHSAAKDAFMRRKNYDPMKAVEDEKLKRRQQQALSLQPSTSTGNSASSRLHTDEEEEEDFDDTFTQRSSHSDLTVPIQKLKSSIPNRQPLKSANSTRNSASTILKTQLISKSTVNLSNSKVSIGGGGGGGSSSTCNSRRGSTTYLNQQQTSAEKKRPIIQKSHSINQTSSACKGMLSLVNDDTCAYNNSKTKTRTVSATTTKQTLQKQNSESTRTMSDSTNTYENLLKSTVQRLCIRLIKTSTSIMDKIGDTNSSSKMNDESLKIGSSELERMQNLAKIVHSMQIINDHIQTVDSALFTVNNEENMINLY